MTRCSLCEAEYQAKDMVDKKGRMLCIPCINRCNQLLKKEGFSVRNAQATEAKTKKIELRDLYSDVESVG